MATAEAQMLPGAPEGPSQLAEGVVGPPQPPPLTEGLALTPEACWAPGEEMCPAAPAPEGPLELLDRPKAEAEAPEEKEPQLLTAVVRPVHGPKRKPATLPGPGQPAHPRVETELPPSLPPPKEEPSPTTKQHKKAKKRKSLGVPVPPAAASTAASPSEALGLERKAPRLRPLYQYINHSNPELNRPEEGHGEAEADVEGDGQQGMAPAAAALQQLQALLPSPGELGSRLAVPCPVLLPPAPALAPLGHGPRAEPRGMLSLGVGIRLKAEVDKTTQVDINKMLRVCAAPLVPPLSPQYK